MSLPNTIIAFNSYKEKAFYSIQLRIYINISKVKKEEMLFTVMSPIHGMSLG